MHHIIHPGMEAEAERYERPLKKVELKTFAETGDKNRRAPDKIIAVLNALGTLKVWWSSFDND